MYTNKFSRRSDLQSGQALVFVMLGLGIFLLGAIAFAVDLSNLWFRRQMAQTAADAACTAGAMDLLVNATNGTTTLGNFDTSKDANPYDCSTGASPNTGAIPVPCHYAALNGFNSSISSTSTVVGNNVSFSWSPVAPTPPGVTAPPASVAPTAFMQVIITENSPTFFAGLLRGLTQQFVGAKALCGIAQDAAPIPILVLDPQTPAKPSGGSQPAALNVQGTPTIQIFGGPQRSIQDNSAMNASSCGATNCSVNQPWGTASIDLHLAGPQGTGADMGVSGSPTSAPSGFSGGTTGHWLAPVSPIIDPFEQVCHPGQTTNCSATIDGASTPTTPVAAPAVPSDLNTTNSQNKSGNPCVSSDIQSGNCFVTYKTHGCPDPASTITTLSCVIYTRGAYPSGIAVKNVTAVFDPGLYYVTGGLALQSNSTARPGTGLGDGSGGVTFYFNGAGTISVASDSGSKIFDNFNTLKGPVDSTGTPYPGMQAYTMGVQCLSTSSVPTNLLGTGSPSPGININGNILLAPCTGYYGDPLGASAPTAASTPPGVGEQRGFLYFQDRSATGVQPGFGGGGQFLLAGIMYFHSCVSTTSDAGAGVQCSPVPSTPTTSSSFQDIFSLSGNSGASTYVLGEIVTDNLTLGGGGTINMDLNPSTAFNILKASLYQ